MLSSADLAVACVVLLAVCPVAGQAFAAEPAGQLTLARDVPVHNAFGPRPRGEPTNVATAREDQVIAATGGLAIAPQTMSDASLGDVAALQTSQTVLLRPDGIAPAGATAATSAAALAMVAPAVSNPMAGSMQSFAGSVSALGSTLGSTIGSSLGAGLAGLK